MYLYIDSIDMLYLYCIDKQKREEKRKKKREEKRACGLISFAVCGLHLACTPVALGQLAICNQFADKRKKGGLPFSLFAVCNLPKRGWQFAICGYKVLAIASIVSSSNTSNPQQTSKHKPNIIT